MFLDLQPIIEKEIGTAMRLMIPEEVTLISPEVDDSKSLQDLNDLRMLMRLSPILPMVLLLMITIVAVRSLSDWLYWWGIPFWIAGLFSLALIIVSGALAALLFQVYVVPVFPGTFPPNILEFLEGIVSTIAYDAVQITAKSAGMIVFIGMIMVAVAFLFRKRLSQD